MLPLLENASHPRIVFVTSKFGSLSNGLDPKAGFHDTNYMAYRASKTAVNMLAVRYGVMLEKFGGRVNAACPGLVSTKLVNNHPAGSTAEEGARIVVGMALAEKGGAHGTFTDKEGVIAW
jgi:NAD(P)-dependent dehydrogenase (short-subunit alcohol dehydrogenase family)